MGPERSGRPTELDVGEVLPEEIEAMAARLAAFAEPYQALLGVNAQRAHLRTFVGGLVGGIERKSVEPIALENGQERGPLQHFVGSSKWDESPLLARLRLEVSQEIGDPDAVLVVDGSAVPKKGRDSVGVTRQWCGRLGKVENCQVGVYLAYAASGSGVLVDRRLYLPRDLAKDKARRKKVHVPEDVKFKRAWELADEMLATSGSQLPHKWIVGDDEYGRPSAFRDRLAERSERYVLEVPSSTRLRAAPSHRVGIFLGLDSAKWCICRGSGQAIESAHPNSMWISRFSSISGSSDSSSLGPHELWSTSVRKLRAGSGRPPSWHTIKALVRRAPVDAWDCYQVRDGQKGPIQVRAIRIPVETRRPRADPRRETLLVMETLDGSDRWHFLTNASDEEPTNVLVRVAGQRHLIEEAFELGKGEAGLDHYEVRTWQGWHHHTACALLGGWFLVRESRRLGKKSAPDDCEPGPVCVE